MSHEQMLHHPTPSDVIASRSKIPGPIVSKTLLPVILKAQRIPINRTKAVSPIGTLLRGTSTTYSDEGKSFVAILAGENKPGIKMGIERGSRRSPIKTDDLHKWLGLLEKGWRRVSESNRRIGVLQTPALPLG
jgi:hypothetical protein